jgi:hypothetical protein
VGAEASEHAQVDAHEPGGVSLDANPAPAPTKGTASVELAGRAVKATTAQPEALDHWAKSEAWCGLGTLPLPLPRKAPTVGRHRPEPPLPLSQKDTGVLGMPP